MSSRGTSSRSIFFTPSTAAYCFILVIWRKSGSVLDDAMFLHTTLVAIEEHVVYLFIIFSIRLFLLNDESYLELLQLLLQSFSLLISLLLASLHRLPFLDQPPSLNFNRLFFFFPPSSKAQLFLRQVYEQQLSHSPSWFRPLTTSRKAEHAAASGFEPRLSLEGVIGKLLRNEK